LPLTAKAAGPERSSAVLVSTARASISGSCPGSIPSMTSCDRPCTSAQVLAAGIPQLLRPMAYDQFDDADLACRLGVAVGVRSCILLTGVQFDHE
jgi:hypothetical protein